MSVKLSHSDRARVERKVRAAVVTQCEQWDAIGRLENELDYEADDLLSDAVKGFALCVSDPAKITDEQIASFTDDLLKEFCP